MRLEEARARIRAAEHLRAFISVSEESGPGPVVAVKDMINVRGFPTTAGSPIGDHSPAVVDAEVVRLARRSGCAIIGKTNLHEWAMGATSENPYFGAVRNPHEADRIAGGSSGGSAAAVAAGLCDWAIGTDTGGSIRIPAALCGVVGLKPTLGAVSTAGVIPLSPTLDVVGPITPDAESAAGALAILSRGGATSIPTHIPSLSSFRVAIPHGWVTDLDDQVARTWAPMNAQLPEVEVVDRSALYSCHTVILLVEAAQVHSDRMRQHRRLFGTDVIADLLHGQRIPRPDYVAALHQRTGYQSSMFEIMRHVDALILPTTARTAPLVGESGVRPYLNMFTRPFNLTGQPAISIPARSSPLPVGIQLVGQFGEDDKLLTIARALEVELRRYA